MTEMVTLRCTAAEKARILKAAKKQKTTVTNVLLSGVGARKAS